MKKKIFTGFLMLLVCSLCYSVGYSIQTGAKEVIPVVQAETVEKISEETALDILEPVDFHDISIPQGLSEEEINLIALCCMGEAEGEPEIGKRLVIDTILNRVDSPLFPDTIADVIWQKDQFACMTNGRIDRCYVTDEICALVLEELDDRTDKDVIFFRTKRYSAYGYPLFQCGAHYFSGLEETSK